MQKNILNGLCDYMFTSENLNIYTKHITQINIKPKSSLKNIVFDQENEKEKEKEKEREKENKNTTNTCNNLEKKIKPVNEIKTPKKCVIETMYKPKQTDSLFWCLYILKHGYSNYEMEINNQHFVVEKKEKFKYIEMLRKNKDILKIHKIKPFTELEDDLANQDKISIKTFFALCILENINVLLVDKRKIFELTCTDIDETHPVNVIHRNTKNYEHYIELNTTDSILKNYRETYYKSSLSESSIKSIGSYKLDELIDLCKKLNININLKESGKKKLTKKDIYELLVLNY